MAENPKIELRVLRPEGELTLTPSLGENLRACLLAAGVSLYRGAFKSLNCQGMGVCGSCRVRVKEKGEWWSRRACQIRCFQSLEIELE